MTGNSAHANNGHREKLKRTWRTPRKHPTARDRRETKAWISCKAPNTSEKMVLGEQGLGLSPTPQSRPEAREQKTLTGVGRFFRAEGQSFLLALGMALCSQKSKP